MRTPRLFLGIFALTLLLPLLLLACGAPPRRGPGGDQGHRFHPPPLTRFVLRRSLCASNN